MSEAYYNDIDPFCCKVLRKQIDAGNLPPGVVDERDIRAVHPDELRRYGQVHLFAGIGAFALGFRWARMPDDFPILTAGFPCQDVSNAGKRKGLDGERSGLFFDAMRTVRCLRPRFVVMENVTGLLVRGLDRVLGELAASGFDAEWRVLGADAFGASQHRKRLWILAYPNDAGCERAVWSGQPNQTRAQREIARREPLRSVGGFWPPGPRAVDDIPRMADGPANRLDRLRAIGNGISPAVTSWLGERIVAAHQACQFCGYRFDVDRLGKYGCANCCGDGLAS